MLRLAIPKGSLEEQTLRLLRAADLAVRRRSERDYHGTIDDERIERVSVLRPQEIPAYVEDGLISASPDATGSSRPARTWRRSRRSPTRRAERDTGREWSSPFRATTRPAPRPTGESTRRSAVRARHRGR